jgi:biopolymer transport protein ExbD
MKIRHTGRNDERDVKLQMTPMIDIVFQLLVFFIMTFRIIAQEGDFNIRMPLHAPTDAAPDDTQVPPMTLRVLADEEGHIAGIRLNERSFENWDTLQQHIITILGDETGPGSIREQAEVELDCDYGLHYEHVIAAITAVSGYVENGRVFKLVENIKFAPPRGSPSAE